jgi:hypothetical protein
MDRFSVLSKRCPVCNGTSVQRIDGQWGFKSPTHRCPDCKATLGTSFSAQVLWAVPAAAISFALMYFLITWLQQSHLVGGIVRAVIIGGIVGLAAAVPAKIALRGIVFHHWAS